MEGRNAVIVVGGMIGCGKTTVSEMLAQHFGTKVFYESVKDNRILPMFYTATPEEREAKRYPFLLQLEFLNSRFRDIKEALQGNVATVMDRSIYEDQYFAKVNRDLGAISQDEYRIYESLLENMMSELGDLPKKSPDLFVYLYSSRFDTIMERISNRGRDFEQGEELVGYYWKLYQGYDNWLKSFYNASDVVSFNISQMDFKENEKDRNKLFEAVEHKLKDVLSPEQFSEVERLKNG